MHVDWPNSTAAIVALVALIVSYMSFRYTTGFNQSQVMIDFHRRFDELTKAKYEILSDLQNAAPTSPGDNPRIAGFIMRYWDMHYAQFVFWKQGLLKETIYEGWLDTLHDNARWPIIKDTSYADAWAYVREQRRFSAEFNQFMDSVFENGAETTLNQFRNAADQYR